MKSEREFLELLKAGLWGSTLDLSVFGKDTDWTVVYQLAKEQTVIGVITDGLSALPKQYHGARPTMMQFFARTMSLEDENRRMNSFVPQLMTQLERKGVHSMLLKGAGVATCYRQPLHRVVGDIDLLVIDAEEYQKARELMLMIAKEIESEDVGRKHSAFNYKGMTIEVHGDFRFNINKQCRLHTSAWKKNRLAEGGRHIEEGLLKGAILPPVQFDVLFIFAHMVGHYQGSGGVGLRQVSDWLVFLKEHIAEINLQTLEEDLDFLGLRKYWEVFGTMAVDQLGFPEGLMPLYNKRYARKGRIVLHNIFKTGNFGTKQKQEQLKEGANPIAKKAVTFWGQIPVYARNLRVFPHDTLWCFKEFIASSLRGYQTKEIEE